MAYPYRGFWQPADTVKERTALEAAYQRGDRPWSSCGSGDGRRPRSRLRTHDHGSAVRTPRPDRRCSARTATTSPSAPAAPCSSCAGPTPGSRSHALVLTGGGSLREEEERAALAAFCPGADLAVTVLELPDGRVPARWDGPRPRSRSCARGRAGPGPRPARRRRPPGPPQAGRAGAHGVPRPPGARLRDPQVGGRPRPPDGVPRRSPTGAAERRSTSCSEHYRRQRDRPWFDREAFLGLARIRGIECHARYAEAFQPSRSLVARPVWSLDRTMRVLLTGHQGYLGTVMAPILAAAGHEVVGLDSGAVRRLRPRASRPPTRPVSRSTCATSPSSSWPGSTPSIHMAALSNDPLGSLAPEITYDINHHASVRLARLAKDAGVRRFLYASTCSVYGARRRRRAGRRGRPAAAGDAVRGVQGAGRGRPASSWPTPTSCPVSHAQRHRVRLLAAAARRHRAEQPGRARRADRRGQGAVRRHAVAPARCTPRTSPRPFIAALDRAAEAVRGRAFNVGTEVQQRTVAEIAAEAVEAVPGAEAGDHRRERADPRSYRVDFSRIPRRDPGIRRPAGRSRTARSSSPTPTGSGG